MKVLGLTVDGYMRVQLVDLRPEGATMVVVNGDNGQGKSSTIDAIWAALSARKFAPEVPVHEGMERARIRVDLGEIIVTRTFTAATGTNKLEVTSAEGAKFSSPQMMLDKLMGALSFDPGAFIVAKPREQLEQLLAVVDLGFDPAGMAEERKGLYDQRTEVNREVRSLEARLNSMPPGNDGEPYDIGQLLQQLQRADADEQVYDASGREYQENGAKIARMQAEISQLESRQKELVAKAEAVAQRQDPAPLRAQLAIAETHNRGVEAYRQRQLALEQHRDVAIKADQLTASIYDLDRAKEELLAKAAMPVEGLGFTEDGVTLAGVPFEQGSTAEKLRAAVAIAMAANPQLKVIRVSDGSLLDGRSMKLLEELAEARGYQVWVERVGPGVGITIEDGKVQS